jgi:DNA (cytosine-5)-methyltransferase 1
VFHKKGIGYSLLLYEMMFIRSGERVLQNELDMSFNYEPIRYGEIKSGKGKPVSQDTQTYKLLCIATKEDLRLADIFNRLGEKERCFNNKIAWDDKVLHTLTAKLDYHRGIEKERLTEMDIIHAQTFAEDYNFMSDSWSDVAYICGMSVPPIMISRIVNRLIEGGIFNVTK